MMWLAIFLYLSGAVAAFVTARDHKDHEELGEWVFFATFVLLWPCIVWGVILGTILKNRWPQQ